MTRRRTSSLLVACAAASLFLTGCGSTQETKVDTTTLGKELEDLDAARDKGLLTEKEYQEQRAAMLKRYNK